MPGGGLGSVIKWTLINTNNCGVRELHVARRNSHKKIQLLRIPSSRQDQNKKLFGALAGIENSASKETSSKPSLPQVIFRNNEGHECESFAAQFDPFLVINGEFTRTLNEISSKCGSESMVRILNCLVRSEGFSQHNALHHHSNGTDKRDQLEFLRSDELDYLNKLMETSKLECKSVEMFEGSIEKKAKSDGLESGEGQKQVKADVRKKRKIDQLEGGAKKSKRDEVVRKNEINAGLEEAFQSKYLCKKELSLDQLFIHPVFENDINYDRVKQLEISMAEVYNREFTITVIPKEKQTDILGNVVDNKEEFYVISGSKAITALKNLKKDHHPNFAYNDFRVSAVIYEWEGSLVAHYGKVRSNFVASETPAGGLNIQDFVFMFNDFFNSRMTRDKARSAIAKIMLLTKRPPEQRAAMDTFCKSLPTKIEKMCEVLHNFEAFNTTDVTEKLTTHQKKFSNDKLPLPMPVKLFIQLSRIPDGLFEDLSDSVLQREISVKEMVEKYQNIKDMKNVEQQVCSLLKIDDFQKAKNEYPKMLEPEKLNAFRKSMPPKNNLKLLPRLQLEKYIDALKSSKENLDCGNIEMKEVEKYSTELLNQIATDSTAIIVSTSGEGNFLKCLLDLSENSKKENQILFLITHNTSSMSRVIETAMARKNNSSLLIVIQFLKKSSSVSTSLIKENLDTLIILGKFSLDPGILKAFYPDHLEEKLTEVVCKLVSPGQTISVLSPAEVKYKMDASHKLIQNCKIVYYASGNSLSKLRKDLSTKTLNDGSSNPFVDSPIINRDMERNLSPLKSITAPRNISPLKPINAPHNLSPIIPNRNRVFSPRKDSSVQSMVKPVQSTPIKSNSHKSRMKMADKENLQPLDSYEKSSDHLISQSLQFDPMSQSSLQTYSQITTFSQPAKNLIEKSPDTDGRDGSSESSKARSKIATPTLQIKSRDTFLEDDDLLNIKESVEHYNEDSTVDLEIKDIVGECTFNLSCHIVEVFNEKNLILRVKDGTESTIFSLSRKSETVQNTNLPYIDVWVTHPDIIDKVKQEEVKKGSHIKIFGLQCKYFKEEDSQGFSIDYVNSDDMKADTFQFIIEKRKNKIDAIELLDVIRNEDFNFGSVKGTRKYKPLESTTHPHGLNGDKDSKENEGINDDIEYMNHNFDFNPGIKVTRRNKNQERELNNPKDNDTEDSGYMDHTSYSINMQSQSQLHTSLVLEEMIESAVTENIDLLTPQTYKYPKDDKKLDQERKEIEEGTQEDGTYLNETDQGDFEKMIDDRSLQGPVTAKKRKKKDLRTASNTETSGHFQSSPIAEEEGLRRTRVDADRCETLSLNDKLVKSNTS